MRPIALLLAIAIANTNAAEIPMVAHYPMDGDAFRDQGGVGIEVRPGEGVSAAADGKSGGCWRFAGKGRAELGSEHNKTITDMIGSPLTVGVWVNPDVLPPAKSPATILSKRISYWQGYTFWMILEPDGGVSLSAQNGRDTVGLSLGKIATGNWTHLAFTHSPDGDLIGYRNGTECGRVKLEGTLSSNDLPLLVGHAEGHDSDHSRRTPFTGRIDDLRIYAATLDAATIAKVAAGETLPTRPARKEDLAPNRMPVMIRLARFDMAQGFKDREQMTRMPCRRLDGADVVDWPRMWIGDRELFAKESEERILSNRRLHQMAGPLFQQPADAIIRPGNHWYRPLCWMWGHTFIYTTDSSIRGSSSELEIWTFPVLIRAQQAGGVKSAKLTCGGRTIYERSWEKPLDSLTLCLPQNRPGPAYELSVNGSKTVAFDAGLKPVVLGDPREEPLPIDLQLSGAPAVTVRNLEVPEVFPFKHELKKQIVEMRERRAPWPKATPVAAAGTSFTRHLGIAVPRAPVQTYAVNLTHGMSGGFWLHSAHGPRGQMNNGRLFPADADGFAKFLAGQNLDAIFDMYQVKGEVTDERNPDALAAACLRHGVRVGWNVVSIGSANLAYYSRALPDSWLPKLRDAQLVAQRTRHMPHLAGLTIGADNGGYVPYWDWAPPHPNRPWGEAFLAVNGVDGLERKAQQPVGPALALNAQKGYEVAGTQKDFIDYVRRYDATFLQYGQFQARIHEVDPAISLTTGSYGSGPGVLTQGGWPCASINGEPLFKGLDVLQSYDWDETDAEKPLHNLSLMDRLRSWYPDKPARMLLDNFFLKYGREARQRNVAIGLTRGLDMIGHNWMPQPTGDQASPEVCKDEAEMWAWVHRYSGAYAGTRPRCSIGILAVHEQGTSRMIVSPDKPEELKRGSQEGKIGEALLLCHLAGWPARIITPAELQRGLPADMGAVLLTGLNRFDATWLWSDGLEGALKAYTAKGGRLIIDDESVVPAGLSATATGMTIFSAMPQGPRGPDGDKLAFASAREAGNIPLLQQAMAGIAAPLAVSDTASVWAVPHRSGDVDYVTVTNWSTSLGKTSIRQYTPASAGLRWSSARPIYDLSLSKRLSASEAATCDLTKDAVRVYALPPAPLAAPILSLAPGADGFLVTTPVVTAAGKPVAGVPLELTVTGPDGAKATVWSASGRATRLPVHRGDTAGTYAVNCTELCSGLQGRASATIDGKAPVASVPVIESAALVRFLARKEIPLVVALTAEQHADPAAKALGDRLLAICAKAGRVARLKKVSPDDIIVGVQTYSSAQERPKWQTIPADLVLLGDLTSNVLIHDQGLGDIFPPEVYRQTAGQPLARITCSPFVGNYQCLNVLGADVATLTAAVAAIEGR